MAYPATFEEVVDVMEGERSKVEGYSSRQQEFILSEADLSVSSDKFSDRYKNAFIYFAAHVAALMAQGSAGQGTLSGESLGELSQSFTMPVNNPTAEQELLSTQYGRRFAYIRDSIVDPFFVV